MSLTGQGRPAGQNWLRPGGLRRGAVWLAVLSVAAATLAAGPAASGATGAAASHPAVTGTGWTLATAPEPVPGSGNPVSVSCVSAAWCMAAGSYIIPVGVSTVFTEE